MSRCKVCHGKGEIETSPAAYETCKECGGTGREEKPVCRCGQEKFFDPKGIQGWLCPHCDSEAYGASPSSERGKAAQRAKREEEEG